MKAILITLDCLRADHFDGSSGLTPAFDAVRREGTTFNQAISQSQNTLSSHLSLLTSSYLFQHGVYSNREVKGLPPHALPHRLAREGWAVEGLASAEFLARGLADQFGSFDRRFNHPSAPWWSRGWQRLRGYPNRIGCERTLRDGLRWLDRAPARGDAFLWMHLFDAHMVQSAPRKLLVEETRGTTADRSCRELLKERGWYFTPFADYDRPVRPEHFPARYRAAVRYLDDRLGRFIAALQDRGWWDETLLVITSDHGECLMGDHGLFCVHKKLFDETVHVPLWIRFPGGAHAGREIDALVEHVDLAPTILRQAGLDEALYEGLDLARVASGELPGREFAFSEHVDRLMCAVRDRDHLLVERLPGSVAPRGLPLESETVFDRAGRPLPDGPERDAVEARLGAALAVLRARAASRPAVRSAWQASGPVDSRIAEQLLALGYD
jgi:arylsulfatase